MVIGKVRMRRSGLMVAFISPNTKATINEAKKVSSTPGVRYAVMPMVSAERSQLSNIKFCIAVDFISSIAGGV